MCEIFKTIIYLKCCYIAIYSSVFYVEKTLACCENKENENADILVGDHRAIEFEKKTQKIWKY